MPSVAGLNNWSRATQDILFKWRVPCLWESVQISYFVRSAHDDFVGNVDSSVGEMKQVYVLLEFNNSVDNQLRQAWLNHERASRLQVFGKYAGFAFVGLAAVYGLLRIDTWTKGYYSQQLLWGSAVAIIAVVFLLVN